MQQYEQSIKSETERWQRKMLLPPSFMHRKTTAFQQKLNNYIPEAVHRSLSLAIKNLVQAVLFGSRYTAVKPNLSLDLQQTEYLVRDQISFYKKTAAAEGALTGLGGLISGIADFPLFLTIKIKMLFEIAALYGYNVHELKERLFILHIFQLSFSSQQHRKYIFLQMRNWDRQTVTDTKDFNWRKFQQEYRDHLDIAKLAQLLPGVGAVVGYIVNKEMTGRLGYNAMNAYRLRRWEDAE